MSHRLAVESQGHASAECSFPIAWRRELLALIPSCGKFGTALCPPGFFAEGGSIRTPSQCPIQTLSNLVSISVTNICVPAQLGAHVLTAMSLSGAAGGAVSGIVYGSDACVT